MSHVIIRPMGNMAFRLHRRSLWVGLLLLSLTILLAGLLLRTGTMALSVSDVWESLTAPGTHPATDRIIIRVRLPRLLTAVMVGGSLGVSGAIFQSLSRNPLGSPDIIGFTTGAATGAIVQIILFNAGPVQTSLAAVLSGMVTAGLVFVLARKAGTTGGYRLILAGLGLGAVLSGVNTVLLVMGNLDQAASAQLWLAGSLAGRSWSHVVPALIGFAITLPIAAWHARQLEVMEMGDDTARQLGISIERLRLVTVLVAVALAAIATAAAGPIAFVALAAPQLARRLTGAPGVPIVTAALTGMLLLLAADCATQNMPFHLNMPIGLTTGLFGGIYLLWMVVKR
jgi:iron complex transport system permease protein